MKKGITLIAALAVVLAITSGAFAAKQHFAITSSKQIKNGTVSLKDLSRAARKALHGAQGTSGPQGAQGAQGSQGAEGPQGTPGAQGPQGDQGPAGVPGRDGKDAPAAEYGAAAVYVTRGTKAPSAWAKYSTRLGSPIGDTTGGAFRFTCNTAQAPCKVAVEAAVLTDSPSGHYTVYPRVLIQRGGDVGATEPQTYCEYADGSNGAAPAELTPLSLATNPFATGAQYAPLSVNIGGTADCGVAGPAGDVSEIVVPMGNYDVMSTFVFTKS
jgi:hypothetical protein